MAQKGTPTRRVPEEKAASAEEVQAAVEALSPTETNRLLRFAQRRVAVIGRAGKGRDARELLHEAIVSVLSDDRRWNKEKITFVGFLYGAIKSISYNWCSTFDPDQACSASELIRGNADGTQTAPLVNVPSENPDPEQTAIINQESERSKKQISRIKELIASRPLARDIIDGRLEEMSRTEIQGALGISNREYETEIKWAYRTIRDDAARGRSNVWRR